jgi:hypothetical protein
MANKQRDFKTTGSVIRALPATASAARGFNGDVTLDEFAFMADAEGIMDAIMQSTVRSGRRLDFISTPYGQEGAFFDMWEEAGWDVESVWKHPSQMEAFRDYLYKFRKNVDSENGFHAIPWFWCPDLHFDRIRERCRSEAIFYQEYCLGFVDENKSLLPYAVLRRNVKDHLKSTLDLPTTTYPRYMGVDPADSGEDETAIVLNEKIGSIWRNLYVWHKNAPESEYMPIIKQVFYSGRPRVVYVDKTGMGAAISNNIKKMLPNANVEGIHLSNALRSAPSEGSPCRPARWRRTAGRPLRW